MAHKYGEPVKSIMTPSAVEPAGRKCFTVIILYDAKNEKGYSSQESAPMTSRAAHSLYRKYLGRAMVREVAVFNRQQNRVIVTWNREKARERLGL